MKIELDEPTLPKGMELYINNLGVLENGKAVEFSAEEVSAFEAATGRDIHEAFEGNPNIKVGGKHTYKEPEVTEEVITEDKEEVT